MKILSRLGRSKKSGLVGLLFGASALLFGARESYGQAMIKTVPESPTAYLGQTFRMDVMLETTNILTTKIGSADWDVSFPTTRLSFVSSSLPTSDDFFAGITMDPSYNRVDNSYPLNDNVRTPLNLQDSPSNRVGLLGSYWFTPIKTNDNVKFGLGTVVIGDQNGDPVSTTASNIAFNIVNAPAITNYITVTNNYDDGADVSRYNPTSGVYAISQGSSFTSSVINSNPISTGAKSRKVYTGPTVSGHSFTSN